MQGCKVSSPAPQPVVRDTNRVLRVGIRTLCLIFVYYCFSIGLTFYQKWFIASFHFPLTVVLCHLLVKYLLAVLIRYIHYSWNGSSRTKIHWSVSWRKLTATGVCASLDIGFSNWSFEFITVSLYTMTKTSSVIFILAFAILFGLERKRVSVISIVFLISIGLLMFTYKSTQFRWEGFVLVLAASFLAGLRWTLAQLLMQRKEMGLGNPVDMIFAVQPIMIATLMPLVVCIEIMPTFSSSAPTVVPAMRFVETVLQILAGSSLAFLMEMSEYLLLSYTSSLTLSISSIVKEVVTLVLAFELNNDSMSFFNGVGLLICLSGIVLHVIFKARDVSASHIERPMSPYDEQSESEKLLIDDASQLQEKTTDVSDLKLHGRFST